MATTELQAYALPGQPHSFAAKPAGYTWTNVGRSFTYVAANFASVSIYLEAWLRRATGTARADLYDVTAAAQVASSEVTTTSATYVSERSAALTLVDGHVYRKRVGVATDTTETGNISEIGLVVVP